MRLIPLALLLAVLASACAPSAPQATLPLPTLAVLPSLTPSAAVTDTSEPAATDTPTRTLPPTAAPTITSTLPPTRTPRPTETTPATVDPARLAAGTATAAVLEAPRFATFTPAPGGSIPAGTPAQLADIVITESQYQEELDRRLAGVTAIDRAIVDFVPGAINVALTALGGEALTSGVVTISVVLTGDFATISISDIRVNALEPPPAYVETVSSVLFPALLETLDGILQQRLGANQKLRSIAVTGDAIEVTLLVPQQ